MTAIAGLLGGWGDAARELLRRGHGQQVWELGGLSLVARTPARDERWAAWLEGVLDNMRELAAPLRAPADAPTQQLLVLLHKRHGAEAVHALRGAFVLVCMDVERGEALVSRDQLGGRPLVYTTVGDGALFAEHERDLLGAMPHAPPPDRLTLLDWADTGTVPPIRTLYEGVRRLPGGHHLVLSHSGVEVRRYWTPRYEPPEELSREMAAERLREAAFDAVARASGGAARVGLRLSGGLDSSCVAAALVERREPGQETMAFSAVFPALVDADERPLIEATAAKAAMPLELAAMDGSGSLIGPAIDHIERWRLPPATPNLPLAASVGALAQRAGVEVMLDGEGGDELFGLSPYLIADMLRAGRMAAAWRLSALIPGLGPRPAPRMRLRALRFYGARGLVPAAAWRRRTRREADRRDDTIAHRADALTLVELGGDPAWRALDGPLWWRSLAATLSERDRNVDVAAHLRRQAVDMGFEGRHPFLHDLDLMRVALAVPPRLQFDAVRDRPLLRDGLSGRVPEEVLTRDTKRYFNGLLAGALAREGTLLLENLASPDAPLREYAHSERLEGLVQEGRKRTRSPKTATRLWRAGMIDLWLRSTRRPDCLEEMRGRLEPAAQRMVST